MALKQKEETSLYRPVLAEAWRVAWGRKGIWIFGLLASLIMSGGIYDVVLRSWNDALGRRIAGTLPEDLIIPSVRDAAGQALSNADGSAGPALILALLIVLVVVTGGIWAAVTSQGALVAAAAADGKKKTLDSRRAFHAGLTHFWPVLAIDLAAKLLLALFVAGTGLAASRLLTEPGPQTVALYIAAFMIAIPLALATLVLSIYAITAIVVDEQGLNVALRNAWTTLTRHWLIALEMAALLLAVDILAALVVGIIFLVLAIPASLLFGAATLYQSTTAVAIALGVAGALALGIVLVLGAALTTFRYACWTRLYLRLADRGALSKVIRFLSAVPRWLQVK